MPLILPQSNNSSQVLRDSPQIRCPGFKGRSQSQELSVLLAAGAVGACAVDSPPRPASVPRCVFMPAILGHGRYPVTMAKIEKHFCPRGRTAFLFLPLLSEVDRELQIDPSEPALEMPHRLPTRSIHAAVVRVQHRVGVIQQSLHHRLCLREILAVIAETQGAESIQLIPEAFSSRTLWFWPFRAG